MGIFGWITGKTAKAGIDQATSDLHMAAQKAVADAHASALQAVEERNEKLLIQINRTVEIQRDAIKRVENLIARFVIPQEALDQLTGELRAVRWLMDKTGEFRDMDKPRSKPTKEAPEPQESSPAGG